MRGVAEENLGGEFSWAEKAEDRNRWKVLCLNVSFAGCGRQDTVPTQLTWLLRLVNGEVDKNLSILNDIARC